MHKSSGVFTMESKQLQPTHIVGIGASAGGLEAIEAFFRHMPVRTGLSFIVIQHLSPDYKSLMVELLSKKTNIPVTQARDGMIAEADSIYLIPPKKSLTLFHGKLLLKELEPTGGINLPIDTFLRSLAEEMEEKAIAVILSGTGSDGTRGVRAIKEYNGMVMVQEEESAKFDGMPRAAISTGGADFILPPDEMPEQLMAFVKHPYESRNKPPSELIDEGDTLSRIFAELRNKTKVDFSYYKKNTIIRRLERRMAINNSMDIDDYLRYMYSNPAEVHALYRELLIGVTSFFRDPEAMNELMTTFLPELFNESTNRELRFWVAGCSTGEEAYTIAIIAKEVMEEMGISRDIKVFATDIDKSAIQKAGQGFYPESIAADLRPKILGKYFYKKEDSYQIVRNIREMVVFAHHNLIKDPPFTNIDLVSCRNLLIYLQPVLQQKAMENFNFSLNRNGILFLGTSETVGELIDIFEPLNHKFKIFRSKGRTTRPGISEIPSPLRKDEKRDLRASQSSLRTTDSLMMDRYMDLLTTMFVSLSVIVDTKLEILHTFGNPERYFKIPTGKPNFELPRMVIKELEIPLSTGIQKVFRNKKELVYNNINLKENEDGKRLRLRIAPVPDRKGQDPLVAVFFEETEKESCSEIELDAENYDLQEDSLQRIRDLEDELQFTKENLQATIEELETSNEELQATNEELLASNEELQSTNEELQSTNEELYTVNTEYQKKINELTELNNDVENLLTHSRIGKLLLDENLDIRKYSPHITNLFNIIDQDIGRSIRHISSNIDEYNLLADIEKVNKTGKELETTVKLKDGSVQLVRILPYHIGPNVYSGVVLTIVDITNEKKVERMLEEEEERYKYLFNEMDQGVVYQDSDGNITSVNRAAEKILGLSFDQMQGRTSMDPRWNAVDEQGNPLPGDKHPSMTALITGEPVADFVMGVDNPSTSERKWILVNAKPVFRDSEEKPVLVFTTFEDITRKYTDEQELRIMKERLELSCQAAGLAWWEYNVPDGRVKASPLKAKLAGFDELGEEQDLDFWLQLIHPDDYEAAMTAMKEHIEGRVDVYDVRYRLKHRDGSYVHLVDKGRIVERNDNGAPLRVIGTVMEFESV